jgi:hypothetical protein
MAKNINFVEDFTLTPGSDDTVTVELAPGGVNYTWPATDGLVGQALTTDGVGNIEFGTPAGSIGAAQDGTLVAPATVLDFLVNFDLVDEGSGVVSVALNGVVLQSEVGQPNGVASLNGSGVIPQSQVPAIAITNTFVVASEAAMLALVAETGDVAIRTDVSMSYILAGTDPSNISDWEELLSPPNAVQSVNGNTGVVVLDTDDIDEGITNLYFTEERTDDRVATLIQDGTGINWTYDDGGNTLTGDVNNLTVTEFASPNVSQWTNDAGYITATALGIDIAQDGVVQAAGATEIDFLVNFDVSPTGEISHNPDAEMRFNTDVPINFYINSNDVGGSIYNQFVGTNFVVEGTFDLLLRNSTKPVNNITIPQLGIAGPSINSQFCNIALTDNSTQIFFTDISTSPTLAALLAVTAGNNTTGFVSIRGFNGGSVVSTIAAESTGIDLRSVNLPIIIGDRSSSVRVGGSTVGGSETIVVSIGNNDTTLAESTVEILGGSGDGARLLSFFQADPTPQPILTSGTQQELTAALGSTSGLGLVDDSAAAAWVPVVTTPEVVDSNNSNSYAPVNPQRKVTYLIDTLTDGPQTAHIQPDDWEPGDIIRFVDYESNFSSDSFTIDFESHNFEGTGSATLVMSVTDGAITLEYIDVTRGFQRISVV